jgi:hypothetical protein
MKPASAFPASARRQLTFEQAALAMSATVCELGVIRAQESITIECEAPDRELLFVEWLNALIYEMSTRCDCAPKHGADRGGCLGHGLDASQTTLGV